MGPNFVSLTKSVIYKLEQMLSVTEVKQKRGYAKIKNNYTILALNCILKNSKEIIWALEINKMCRKNNIE